MNKTNYFLALLLLIAFNLSAQTTSFDSSFGSGGRATHQNPLILFDDYGTCLAYQPDNKILVGLSSGGVLRILPSGEIDSSFAENGFFTNPLCEGALEIICLPDGKILYSGINYNQEARLYRINPDGQPDSTFGTNGVARVFVFNNDISNSIRSMTDMIVQPDGKVLFITTNGDIEPKYQTLVRLKENGSLDPEFGNSGRQKFYGDQGQILDHAELAIKGNGEILVGFEIAQNGQKKILVSRFTPTGQLDTTFGNNGFIPVDNGTIHKMIIPDPEHFLVFGQDFDSIQLPTLYKYWNDGNLDSSFAINGIAHIPGNSFVGNSNKCKAFLQSDGKILVMYGFKNLLRFNSDGSMDTSLGINGLLPRPTLQDQFIDAMQQPDGKIIATTYYAPEPDTNVISILRYLDSNFVGSIEAFSPTSTVLLYPNPVSSNEFTIAYELPEITNVNMTLISLTGQLVIQLNFPSQEAGRHEKVISLPMDIPSGYYILNIQTQHGDTNVKVLIVHH
jgi:uncharacterized delta-60 repeat protein